LLNLAAVAAHISRAAQLIGALIMIALLRHLGPRLFRRLSRSEKNIALGGAAAILFVIFAIGQATHLEKPVQRWETLSNRVGTDARWSASRLALNILPDASVLGFGPGTFRVVFPAYTKTADASVAGQ